MSITVFTVSRSYISWSSQVHCTESEIGVKHDSVNIKTVTEDMKQLRMTSYVLLWI